MSHVHANTPRVILQIGVPSNMSMRMIWAFFGAHLFYVYCSQEGVSAAVAGQSAGLQTCEEYACGER